MKIDWIPCTDHEAIFAHEENETVEFVEAEGGGRIVKHSKTPFQGMTHYAIFQLPAKVQTNPVFSDDCSNAAIEARRVIADLMRFF